MASGLVAHLSFIIGLFTLLDVAFVLLSFSRVSVQEEQTRLRGVRLGLGLLIGAFLQEWNDFGVSDGFHCSPYLL